MTKEVGKMFVQFLNFMTKRGDLKELKFPIAVSDISRQRVWMEFSTKLY